MPGILGPAPLGDPKHGGALFLLQREIRDEIYRLLVKGSYLGITWFYRYREQNREISNVAEADLSVLRLSEAIGREATEILYSESVFRFSVLLDTRGDYIRRPDLDRMKRLALSIKRLVLEFESPMLGIGDYFHTWNVDTAILIFGGSDIKRQSVQVRMLGCHTVLLKNDRLVKFGNVLKTLVGFRTTTVEILSWRAELEECYYHWHFCDAAWKAEDIRRMVGRIGLEVAKHLTPDLGPAISGFKSDTGNVPIPNSSLSSLGNIGLVGFLEFHPSKHSIESDIAEETGSQGGASVIVVEEQ